MSPHLAVLNTLRAVIVKHGRGYAFPSQQTILKLLARHDGVVISRRTLNRILKTLEREQFIKRIRRHRVDKNLGMVFASTSYYILEPAQRLFEKGRKTLAGFASFFRVPRLAQQGKTDRLTYHKDSGSASREGCFNRKWESWLQAIWFRRVSASGAAE